MKTLILVDVQKDFIDGALGNEKAQEVFPKIVEFVKNFEGKIKYTQDIHYDFDKPSIEIQTFGKHCIADTIGQRAPLELQVELDKKDAVKVLKETFMPDDEYDEVSLWENIFEDEEAENLDYQNNDVFVCGYCTDLCVLNTALYLRNKLIYDNIIVLSDLCAGTSEENHQKALDIMKVNLIQVRESEEV